jgi:hypothetical protein
VRRLIVRRVRSDRGGGSPALEPGPAAARGRPRARHGPARALLRGLHLPALRAGLGARAGSEIQLAFRHLALKAKHPRAVALACAVEAAGLQGRFWELAEALYADPGRTEDPQLWARLEALGVDLERWDADRRSEAVAARVARDVRDALRAGAVATPTLFAGTTMLAGPPDAAWLAAL